MSFRYLAASFTGLSSLREQNSGSSPKSGSLLIRTNALEQALQIMNFRESGDQDNDHEGNSEEVVIKIMITRKFLESGDQDNDHGVYS